MRADAVDVTARGVMAGLAGLAVALAVALAPGCSAPDPAGALQAQAAEVAHAYQPALDALVARIAALHRTLRGNLPGWETMLRNAEAANDQLGLPPFEQVQPPGPAWRPSPASLLGIAPYVGARAAELARDRRIAELAFVVADEQRRYRDGIAEVDRRLTEIERWLATR